MNIIHVIPLSKGIFKDELTYFTSRTVAPGTLVSVPVRSRTIHALVVSQERAIDAKSRLRGSSYAIKKVENISGKKLFSSEFISAAEEAAKYFASSTGEILQSLIPRTILSEYANDSTLPTQAKQTAKEHGVLKNEKFVFQADNEERFSTYKSLIREEFAKGSSVFFCLPTIEDIERVGKSLERGIKEYTYMLHGGLSKKQLLQTWKSALKEPHPVLIVATSMFLSLPREDLRTLIMDKEHSNAYKTLSRPFIDIRKFAEYFAEHKNIKLIFGDIFLRPETLWRHEQGEFLEFVPLKFRVLPIDDQEIIDMRKYKKEFVKSEFRMVGDELNGLIERTKKTSEHMLVLCARRGLYPITTCSDCGTAVTCKTCSTPLVLHKDKTGKEQNIYLCHKCGSRYTSKRTCESCGSWRLAPLGIGTEKIFEEIKGRHKEVSVFRIDSESTPTPKKARAAMDSFFESPGSVLVGTEMALHYLDRDVANSAIASIDSLFTIPDFRINEKIFNMLLGLHEKTRKSFLIQTRDPEQSAFQYIMQGNLLDFYREEIEARKRFGYPPFSTCIKITTQGRKDAVQKALQKVCDELAEYEPMQYPSFTEEVKGSYRENILIRLPKNTWVSEPLLKILRNLPPQYAVRVDPENLL